VFWHFAAFTAQHRRTWLAVYAVPPMSTVIVTSARQTVSLVVPSTRRTTLGDRAFPVYSCSQSMERPSANDQGLTVAADVPPTTVKNFFFKQHFTDLMTGLSVLNCVKCPCNVVKC